MRRGKPLRFLAATMTGWVGLRAVLLWPVPDVLEDEALAAPAVAPRPGPTPRSVAGPLAAMARAAFEPRPTVPNAARVRVARLAPPASRSPVYFARAVVAPVGPVAHRPSVDLPSRSALVAPTPPERTRSRDRWSASAWVIARPSGTRGGLGASQLGGGQAGARLAYALDGAGRLAIVARMAAPLEGRGREAALGVEWRPTRHPVRLFAEGRAALDRGRGGPAAGVIAGAYEPLPRGFRLEAYGQAGVIARGRVEGFADGAARVARPVASVGRATLDLGAGAWGGAQRGAERLDVGPTLGLATPVAGRTVRLTLDYRARIAGDARPGSGPALSVGTDF